MIIKQPLGNILIISETCLHSLTLCFFFLSLSFSLSVSLPISFSFFSFLIRSRMNVLLPKVVVPGQSTTALIHFHNKLEEHNVTMRLVRILDNSGSSVSPTDVLAQNTVLIKGKRIHFSFCFFSPFFQPLMRKSFNENHYIQ